MQPWCLSCSSSHSSDVFALGHSPALVSCRGKTARVISYEEFKKALEELAPKRFKGKNKEEAFESICQLVAGKEPTNVGVTVSDCSFRTCRAGVWALSGDMQMLLWATGSPTNVT